MSKKYVIGLDYGSDSVRAVLVDTTTGEQVAEAVHYYRRWAEGRYCNPTENRFRQHPLDYVEGLEKSIKAVVAAEPEKAKQVVAIALDSTASTPCLADRNLQPLALQEKYAENPDAMFVLWKDHTAEQEAAEINYACKHSAEDYSKFTGYHYSSECFWAKVLHLLRSSEELRADAYTVVEECDWIPSLLTATTDPDKMKMGHCCVGQKMFWSEEWGGFPPREFFERIDPLLLPILDTLHPAKYTCDTPYGNLCKEWAERLGLSTDVVVGVGNVDSHQGAIGAGVAYRRATLNLGTSAGCMAVMPKEGIDHIIDGVFGQVDSGIIPGMIGFEVGLSAFGDVYAWLKRLVEYPVKAILSKTTLLTAEQKKAVVAEIEDNIMAQLNTDASALPLRADAPFATDWFNGRRSPAPSQKLWGSVMGLRLSSSAAEIYYALVEATAFAMKAIIDHLENNGIEIDTLVGVGGISQKSPFVMQMLADVIGKDIHVSGCRQSCALGSAICASVVGGIYASIEEAQAAMCQPILKVYHPDTSKSAHFETRYALYRAADEFTCNLTNK